MDEKKVFHPTFSGADVIWKIFILRSAPSVFFYIYEEEPRSTKEDLTCALKTEDCQVMSDREFHSIMEQS